jgi:hypothetical protein
MLVGQSQEPVHPLQETSRVLLPQQILEKNAYAREAQPLCPAKFAVDRRRIKRIRTFQAD